MEYDCGFNTKLLHGKTSIGFPNREILPPISQVTAFRYDSMEELERVFLHKSKQRNVRDHSRPPVDL